MLVRDEVVTQERYARFYRSYGWLSTGMSTTHVHSALGSPVHSCRYRGTVIQYFMPPEPIWQNPGGLARSREIPADLPMEVRDFEDIPYVYAAVKVAFDANERVAGFEWNSHLGSGFRHALVALDR